MSGQAAKVENTCPNCLSSFNMRRLMSLLTVSLACMGMVGTGAYGELPTVIEDLRPPKPPSPEQRRVLVRQMDLLLRMRLLQVPTTPRKSLALSTFSAKFFLLLTDLFRLNGSIAVMGWLMRL